jgi:hypothetical protein
MYTRIVNDMNKQVALGTSGEGRDKYYCAQHFGRAALPGSDGYCGPDDGPQCDSCKRFTARVPANIAEIARLRAFNLEQKRIIYRRQKEHDEECTQLRKELDLQKKRIRELEAASGAKTVDEWTRQCDKVWPALFKAVAKGFHPDKTDGNEDATEFFKFANAKNEVYVDKMRQSTTEGEGVVAPEAKRQKINDVHKILAQWDLESEATWLFEQGVECVDDLKFFKEIDVKDRNPRLKNLIVMVKECM